MEILQWSAIFIAALSTLLISAGYLTSAAEKIGIHFKIPPFIIGVTIVALGTSLPEIATSISAVLKDNSEIVIANVAGSNIANILLVLGVSAIVAKKLTVSKEIISIDLPILLSSTILIFLTTLDGKFTYIDGTISILILATYTIYNLKSHRKIDKIELKEIQKEENKTKKVALPIKYPIILIVSAIILSISSGFTIDAVIKLSEILNIGKDIIAISAIAIGTSLPELVTSVIAAKRGKADIAIGNVTGSNIINALAVMGIPAYFGDLSISTEMIGFTIPALLLITILYVFVTMDKTITQWEGMTLLMLYVAFMGKTFGFI